MQLSANDLSCVSRAEVRGEFKEVEPALNFALVKLEDLHVVRLDSQPPVLLRSSDCVTAVVNLIFNAVDAVKAKGRVTVRTGSSDGGAWIEVEDDGRESLRKFEAEFWSRSSRQKETREQGSAFPSFTRSLRHTAAGWISKLNPVTEQDSECGFLRTLSGHK